MVGVAGGALSLPGEGLWILLMWSFLEEICSFSQCLKGLKRKRFPRIAVRSAVSIVPQSGLLSLVWYMG